MGTKRDISWSARHVVFVLGTVIPGLAADRLFPTLLRHCASSEGWRVQWESVPPG